MFSNTLSFTPLPILYKNVSLAVLFGSNGNSYTVCTPSDMRVCVCVCVYSSQYRDAGGAKEVKKMGQQLMLRARRSSAMTYTVITTSYSGNDCFSIILLSKPIPEDGI